MKYNFNIIVIGAGSGGLVVASAAASLGAKVALIEGHKMGGDCLNYGCIPSKAFLRPVHLLSDIKDSTQLGLPELTPKDAKHSEKIDIGKIMDHVQSVVAEIEPHDSKERYEGMGVTVIDGLGQLIDKHRVNVNGKEYTAKYIVISTGSTATLPPIPGLAECRYLTNHNFFQLKKTPKHLIVLGAGPIGLELGQGCKHLGSKVTVIDQAETLFSKDDPEVGPLMYKIFKKEGIQFKLGVSITKVEERKPTKETKATEESKNTEIIVKIRHQDGTEESIIGDEILVALGRRPVTEALGCENAGVELTESGYIKTNDKLQTTTPNIYACGDVVGPYQFTHMAGYQAGIVIRNIIFKMGAKVNYSVVPWNTYTKPEIAHVGYTEPWAKNEGLYKDHILLDLNSNDRSKTENDRHGFLKVIIGKGNRLIGATLVGEKAGEIIPLATLAIQQKLKVSAFMNLIFAYPSQAEIFKFASLEFSKKQFKPWMKKLIKVIFLRR